LRVPSRAMTISRDRSMKMPTRTSDPLMDRRECANASARSFSSR
jgi:hypothetical protein